MILWTIKLLTTAKKAFAGRKHPHQLAWATGFGLLLGIVPHGNLLAVGLLVLVLSLRINHAMVALTAIAATFLVSSQLDPISHELGDRVLTHPTIHPIAVNLWQLPLVPWTDVNNTVVMGSLLIGVAALLPVFVLTYPMFRLMAPTVHSEDELSSAAMTERSEPANRPADARKNQDSSNQVVMVDRGHQHLRRPQTEDSETPTIEFEEVRSDSANADQTDQDSDNRVAVQTRIDVIRMKGNQQPNTVDSQTTDSSSSNRSTEEQPMDEALNYLLRQLRDSQQRSAA